MKSTLPYFALFYAIGIVIFGLFVRFWLRKKRLRDEEMKRGIRATGTKKSKSGTGKRD